MANVCPVCGEKIGGLTGLPRPGSEMKEKGIASGVYVDDMCATCLSRALRGEAPRKTEEELRAEFEERQKKMDALPLHQIFLSPSPVPEGAQDKGLVTGYCILGTGPLSALCSSVTDFLGAKSNVYLEKARIAEREALKSLKIEALKAGGDAVYCLRVNLTEATSGQGMLMVSVSGAATRTQNPSPEALAAMKLFE